MSISLCIRKHQDSFSLFSLWLLWASLAIPVTSGDNLDFKHTFYRGVISHGLDWGPRIYRTAPAPVSSRIECGSICTKDEDLGCGLFVAVENGPKDFTCHLGVIGSLPKVLPTQKEDQRAFVRMGESRLKQ